MRADIDLNTNLLFVGAQIDRNTGLRAPTKSGHARVIPIRPELRSILLRATYDKQPGELITTSPKGYPANQSNLARAISWPAIKNRVKPGLRMHDLRHHAATTFLADGHPLNAVQQWLGHSNIAITSRYITTGETEAIKAVTSMYNKTPNQSA